MPVMVAMPVVRSPKTLPCTIRAAPVKHRAMPEMNRAYRNVLVLFSFYTSLLISNFMLCIYNSMLDITNISLFKFYCAKTAGRKN
jgi:hypothetical protein